MAKEKARVLKGGLQKVPTGIRGLDEITNGGLPKGRPTLVCGGAGSGKTLLFVEFLVRGAMQFNKAGVFSMKNSTLLEPTIFTALRSLARQPNG